MPLNSESDILQICKNIGDSINRNEDTDNFLETLFMLCCGPPEVRNHPVLKVLNSEELLLAILKVNNCSELLKNQADLCLDILRSLLICRKKEWKIIISLIKIVLECEFEDGNTFVQDVWDKKELYMVPAELVLIFINYQPALIEKEMCNLYLTRKKSEDVWKNVTYKCWLFWCSQLPELFQIVTSILNQFLIYVKDNSAMLKIISNFITNVMAECEHIHFFSLYPLEYQSFVASLIIEPEINPCREEIIDKFKSLKDVNKTLMLMFLSHYPFWMDLIKIC